MDSIVISVLGEPINISICFCDKPIKACAYINTCFHLQDSRIVLAANVQSVCEVVVFENLLLDIALSLIMI